MLISLPSDYKINIKVDFRLFTLNSSFNSYKSNLVYFESEISKTQLNLIIL